MRIIVLALIASSCAKLVPLEKGADKLRVIESYYELPPLGQYREEELVCKITDTWNKRSFNVAQCRRQIVNQAVKKKADFLFLDHYQANFVSGEYSCTNCVEMKGKAYFKK